MFSAEQLDRKIQTYADGQISLNEFEDWFRDQSADIHLSKNKALYDRVFSIERLFSERYFAGLGEPVFRLELLKELANAARPFASEFADLKIRFLPEPLMAIAPYGNVPNNIFLDYQSQQYSLFPEAYRVLYERSLVSLYGTSTAVSVAALPSQEIDSAASVNRYVVSAAVAG